MQKFICVDLETTGESPETGAEVIEFGRTDLHLAEGELLVERFLNQKFSTERGIPPETSAIHGIVDCDVAMMPKFGSFSLPQAQDGVFVAHNAKFERQWITDPAAEWICTYKCAMTVWPDAPKHNLGTLLYWLATDANSGFITVAGLKVHRSTIDRLHRAGPDSYANAFILAALLKEHTADALIEISSNPILMSKVTFGKHHGMNWASVPHDYLRWVLSQDFDEDVRYTARHWLNAATQRQ